MNKHIEAEGGELILRNKNGSVAIIPARHRMEVLDMLKSGCKDCLHKYISDLPKMKDYAEGGTLITGRSVKPIDPQPVEKPKQLVLPIPKSIEAYLNAGKVEVPNPLTPANLPTPLSPKEQVLARAGQLTKPIIATADSETTGVLPDSNVKGKRFEVESSIKSDTLDVFKEGDTTKADTKIQFSLPTDVRGIVDLQKQLLQGNYYESTIDPKTLTDKDKIKKVQRLVGVTDDGVVGPITKAAIQKYNNREIDGIVGSRTKAAYDKFRQENINYHNFNVATEKDAIDNILPYNTKTDKTISKLYDFDFNPGVDLKAEKSCSTDDPECASWMFDKLEAAGVDRSKYALYGDAWTAADMIKSGGAKEVYFSGYKKPSSYPGKNGMVNIIRESINNNPLDKDLLKSGQIVEILNPESSNFSKAYSQGKGGTATTHIGLIVKNDKGELVLEHNVHGTIHQDPIDKVLANKNGYKITRVLEAGFSGTPEKSSYVDASNLGITFNKKSRGHNIADKNAYLFQKTIVQNKNQIKNNFGLNDEEFKLVNQIAYGVAANESYFGKADLYKEKTNPSSAVIAPAFAIKASENIKGGIRNAVTYSKAGQFVADQLDKQDKRDSSKGWGQVKDEELFTQQYIHNTGIGEIENPDTPEYSALTTVSSIAAKYKVLSTLITSSGVKVKASEFKAMLAISHNQGFEKIKESLQKYKETGDYSYIEKYKDFRYPKNVKMYSEEYVTFN